MFLFDHQCLAHGRYQQTLGKQEVNKGKVERRKPGWLASEQNNVIGQRLLGGAGTVAAVSGATHKLSKREGGRAWWLMARGHRTGCFTTLTPRIRSANVVLIVEATWS